MSRYNSRSEVDFDARYDDRRGSRRDSDIAFRTGSGAPPVRERERETVIIKEREEADRRIPAFLREDYGRTDAGAMVLRARDREDVTYTPPAPRRRRSSTPEKREREEIIIRRDERSDSRPPAPRQRPREVSREREEIIIRRDERSDSRPPAPRSRPREVSREREEIIIRRDERSQSRGPPPRRERERSREREEIIIRRDERDDYPPPRRSTTAPIRDTVEREEIIIRRDERDTRSRIDDDLISHRSYRPPPPPVRNEVDRQEIIIRREEIDDRSRAPPPPRSRYDDSLALARPISHERSRGRSHSSGSEDEIIIRRDEGRDARGRDTSRQEIIIRRSSHSRSPSPTASVSTRRAPVPEPTPAPPPIVYAPQIHQEVITHHRHIDHGYEVRQPVYAPPRLPSPPAPPAPPPPAPVRERSEERIEIRRSDTRNGRREEEDIIISRNERSQSVGPPARRPEREEFREEIDYSSSRRAGWEERNISEEAEYYNDRALSRGYPGEAYRGATRDWGLVDIPPGTKRVRMDGAGGGGQEISWKRYDGDRRAKYLPDGDLDEGYTTDPGRPTPRPIRAPEPEPEPPTIGPRYGARRDPRDGLWTEITKDLVVKEAIKEMGYEYEETEDYYYIFKYMQYVSCLEFQVGFRY